VQAIGNGEIDCGLVNHYYLYAVGREAGDDFPVANHFFAAGDPGSLINVAGIGLIEGAEATDAALAFADYLLSADAQEYFATETFEYPLIAGVSAPEGLTPLSEIGQVPPPVDFVPDEVIITFRSGEYGAQGSHVRERITQSLSQARGQQLRYRHQDSSRATLARLERPVQTEGVTRGPLAELRQRNPEARRQATQQLQALSSLTGGREGRRRPGQQGPVSEVPGP
jgi:hypothetical protein